MHPVDQCIEAAAAGASRALSEAARVRTSARKPSPDPCAALLCSLSNPSQVLQLQLLV